MAKITPGFFKKLVQTKAAAAGISPIIAESHRSVERSRNVTVRIKVITVIFYKSSEVILRVTYEEGDLETHLFQHRDNLYWLNNWLPADQRNLAKALVFSAELVEEFYQAKYEAEFPEEKEKAVAT